MCRKKVGFCRFHLASDPLCFNLFFQQIMRLTTKWNAVPDWYRAYFKQSLQLHREQKISDLKKIHLPKFLTTFFFHSPEFSPVPSYKQVQKYNCTPKFLMTFFKSFPRKLSFFTPLLHPHTYKVTTTTAQFTSYNCRNYDQLHVKICPGLINQSGTAWNCATMVIEPAL